MIAPRQLRILCALVAAAPLAAQIPGASRLLYNRYGQNEAFSGVASLRADAVCTGVFLKPLAGSMRDDAPAYVLSNGHCLGFLRTNEIILNRAQTGTVTFRRFLDTGDRTESFPIARTAYATMKGTDLAIFVLAADYGELLARGIRPLEIQAETPPPGEPVTAVGVPVTGVPQDEQFLRAADCRVTGAAQLIEFNWTWYGFLRTDCSDIRGGSSGSPLVSSRTGKLVGIINTTTQDAAEIGPGFACYLGVPCEIRAEGPATVKDAAYALPAAGLERCFAATGVLDLALPGCPLESGPQVTLSGYPIRVTQPYRDGRRVTWNTTVAGTDFSHYRYKTVREGVGDCRSPEGYGPVIALASSNRIDDPLPETEVGTYLCVLAGNSAAVDASWQDPRRATFAHVRIDTSPSTVPPVVFLRDGGREYRVDFLFVVPELSAYHYKSGPPEYTDCRDRQGYFPFRRIPFTIAKTGPLKFCAVGEDNAGNWTVPYEQLLDGLRILKDGIVSAASFQTAPLAPGALATVFGVNFTPGEMGVVLRDEAGGSRPATVLYSGADQINFLVPADAEAGPATLAVTRGDASDSAATRVDRASPGIFPASSIGNSTLAYVRRIRPDGSTAADTAFTCSGFPCYQKPIYLNAGDRVFVEVYLTGLGGLTPEVRLSGLPVPVVSAGVVPGAIGVDRVEFELPYSIPVRSYVPLTIHAGGAVSRASYLWLK